MIENKSSDAIDVEYEVYDTNIYNFEVIKIININDINNIFIKFEKGIDFDTFIKHYRTISDDIVKRLSVLNTKNDIFIFIFNINNIGNIVCGYLRYNHFGALIKKFGKGKNRISFTHSIGAKLNLPLLNILSKLDFIIDKDGLYKNKFESIDSKYHISKEED